MALAAESPASGMSPLTTHLRRPLRLADLGDEVLVLGRRPRRPQVVRLGPVGVGVDDLMPGKYGVSIVVMVFDDPLVGPSAAVLSCRRLFALSGRCRP